MIRTIIRSDKNSLTLNLPDDLVGKMIEIIAFPVEDTNMISDQLPDRSISVDSVKNKLKPFSINSGGYKFDRNEANDYE